MPSQDVRQGLTFSCRASGIEYTSAPDTPASQSTLPHLLYKYSSAIWNSKADCSPPSPSASHHTRQPPHHPQWDTNACHALHKISDNYSTWHKFLSIHLGEKTGQPLQDVILAPVFLQIHFRSGPRCPEHRYKGQAYSRDRTDKRVMGSSPRRCM